MKNITNRNTKGQSHGYQERYLFNQPWHRGCFKNGNIIGYFERHQKIFGIIETKFYIK